MEIFKAEIEAGLADAIKNNSLTIACQLAQVSEPELAKAILNYANANANPNQIDLYYMDSILASVGWNKNDDIFEKEESWKARYTPIDKPFNFMHDKADIIGHITSARVLDFEGKEIPLETPFEEVPDQFDIVVGSVIYRHWDDQDMKLRVSEIIKEIEDGKWFVSMECIFKHFDYAIVKPDGVQVALARNEQTSFLTKHLRAYGGEGQYNGYKVGRLLRNFTFSGKGLVDAPGNPRSLILNKEAVGLFNSNASISEFPQEENNVMSKTYTQDEFDALKSELQVAQAKLKEASDKEVSALKVELEATKKEVAKVGEELSAKAAVIEAKDAKVSELEKSLEEAKAELAKANDELQAVKLESLKAGRLSQLVEAGVEDAKAKELADKFVNVSDEVFTELVAAYKGSKKKEKEKEMKKEHEEESCANENVEAALENAELENEVGNTTSTEEETLVSKAAAWILTGLSGKKN